MASEIRKFRSAVARLKRIGLVSKRVDARSVKPSKYWRDKLADLAPVLRGEAEAIVIESKEDRDEYARRGHKTYRKKIVLVKKAPDEKVHVEHGTIVRETDTGIQYVELPARIDNLEVLERWMHRNEARIQGLLKPGDTFAFNYYGNMSFASFNSWDMLVDELAAYRSWQQAIDSDKPKAQQDIIDNIVIMRIPRGVSWNPSAKKMERRTETTKAQRKRYLKRLSKDQFRLSQYKSQQASAAKAYRDRIKADPAKYEAYKAAARKRAKKSGKKK